jgi:hypothetical protein
MPSFRSTYNILTKYDEDEVFNENWMDSDTIILPPKTEWTYDREMIVEDVDIWEIIYEASGGIGVYAAWAPFAEFYMLTTGNDMRNGIRYVNTIPYYNRLIETFYGPGAQDRLFKRAKELGITLPVYKSWVEPQDMWLHTPVPKEEKKIIFIK